MIKYIDIEPYDLGGNLTAVEICPGAGMQKVAKYESLMQDMRDYIANIKPKDGKAFLLIAAMGDQNWGSNKNADFWPTEALSHEGHDYGYLTFEDNGHWYHQHNNKDPEKSYGKVIKSIYNPQMCRIELIVEVDLVKDDVTRDMLANNEIIQVSMGCFEAGTMVMMAGGIEKPIDKIVPGDLVIGHDGIEHPVLSVSNRPYTGQMCRITIDGCADTFCTEDHPYYIVRAENSGMGGYPVENTAEWVLAKNILSGDFALCPGDSPGAYVHKTVLNVASHTWETTVYNLEVEGSNSYIAGGVAVHNSTVSYDICKVCHPNWKDFYKIPEEDMIKLAAATDLGTVYDIGNRNGVDLSYITELNPDGGPIGIHSKVSKYCQHMRLRRNKLLPTGERVCVVNLRPKFFDISRVKMNADKSAFVLDKVAAEISEADEKTLAARLAENEKKASEKKALEEKNADIDKEVPGEVVSDNEEAIKEYYTKRLIPEMMPYEKEIPDEIIDTAARKFSLGEILSTFLTMGMFPHPREFQRIVLIQSGDNDSLAAMANPENVLTPSMLDVIAPQIQMPECDFGIGHENINGQLGEMLGQFVPWRSYYRPYVAKRVIMIKKAEYSRTNSYMSPDTGPPKVVPALLAAIGGIYLAARMTGDKGLNDLISGAVQNKGKVIAGLAGAALLYEAARAHTREMRANTKYNQFVEAERQRTMNDMLMKQSSFTSGAMAVGLPILGSYLMAGHAINKMQRGEDPGAIGTFFAKYPLVAGLGGAAFANRGSRNAIMGLLGRHKPAAKAIAEEAVKVPKMTAKQLIYPAATILGPIAATHAVAANTMNKATEGRPYSGAEAFVTKHPLATGAAIASVANPTLRKFIAGLPNYMMKGAGDKLSAIQELNPMEQDLAICSFWEFGNNV